MLSVSRLVVEPSVLYRALLGEASNNMEQRAPQTRCRGQRKAKGAAGVGQRVAQIGQ